MSEAEQFKALKMIKGGNTSGDGDAILAFMVMNFGMPFYDHG